MAQRCMPSAFVLVRAVPGIPQYNFALNLMFPPASIIIAELTLSGSTYFRPHECI
jgi:hypothetical protein